MRIALITDSHVGVRGDSQAFLDLHKRFLDETFFPYIDTNEIRTVVHLGDLLDKRKVTNNLTMYRLREDFLDPLQRRAVQLHMILGNHDLYYRNTHAVSSVKEILREYPFEVYERPTERFFGDTGILFVPWICDENREETMTALSTSKCPIVLGHLEIRGFEMYRGMLENHGMDANVFDRFDTVCSGHFHHKSSRGGIHYLGSPLQFTWSDYGDPRGFHVLDTETRELTFVENPHRVFEKVWYDDSHTEWFSTARIYGMKDKIVKVIVKSKNVPAAFDKFISLIEEQNPIELQVVEDHLNADIVDDGSLTDTEDTLTVCRTMIDQTSFSDPLKWRVKGLISSLYQEAVSLE